MSLVIESPQAFNLHPLVGRGIGPLVDAPRYPVYGNQKIARNDLKQSLRLAVPDWNFQFDAPITQVDESESVLVTKVALDTDVTMVLHSHGHWLNDYFLIESMNADFEQGNSPRACFTAITFASLLRLAPTNYELQGDYECSVIKMPPWEGPLPLISAKLRGRQAAYRLMVLERVLGVSFFLPQVFTANEEKEVAFLHRAISERRFLAAFDKEEFHLPATEKNVRRLADLTKKKSLVLSYNYKTELLGAQFSVGRFQVKIADAAIENYDEAEQAMARLDGKPVPLAIRSLRGEAEWNFLDVPPPTPIVWEEKIQRLVDLESRLDEAAIARYLSLARTTLDGLTDEEKVAFIERPKLDPEAFGLDG